MKNYFDETSREEEIENLFSDFHVSSAKELDELHYKTLFPGRSFYVWGIGRNMQTLLRDIPCLNVCGFIDNAAASESLNINGKDYPLLNGGEGIWEKLTELIVVSCSQYNEIKEQLEKAGKKEFKDFISWKNLYPVPSQLVEQFRNSICVTNWKCSNPYSMIKLCEDGAIYCCQCQRWVQFPIGNAFFQSVEKIKNSILFRLFALSVETGSYCYCKKEGCKILEKNCGKETKYESTGKIEKSTIVGHAAFDESCNLYCASCRNHIVVVENERIEYLKDYFIKEIMPNANIINVASVGETFLSRYYKEILEQAERTDGIFILSNGILAKKEKMLTLSKKVKNNLAVAISIDAATKDTYEKLRRGANWELLQKNLLDMGELIQKGQIKNLTLNFVISRENYREIGKFVELAEKVKATAILFTRLENWGTYEASEFQKLSMFLGNDQPSPELEKEIEYAKKINNGVRIFWFDDYGARRFLTASLER